MSKFTLDKLKELKERVGVGTPILQPQLSQQPDSCHSSSAPSCQDALPGRPSDIPSFPSVAHSINPLGSAPNPTVLGVQQDRNEENEDDGPKSVLDRDISPIKERLLGTIVKLAQDSGTEDTVEGSWLNQVKGKFAKTVDTSLEKYAELRAERLRSARALEHTNSLDLETEVPEENRRLSHSHSEMTLNIQESPKDCGRPHSQIFDFDVSEWAADNTDGKNENQGKFDTSTPAESSVPTTAETPSKVRKRFGISFLDRGGSPNKSSSGNETPKRTLRSLMRSYVSKPQPEDKLSGSPQQKCTTPTSLETVVIPGDDPFSGTEVLLVEKEEHKADPAADTVGPPVDEDGVEAMEGEVLVTQSEESSEKVEVTDTPDILLVPPSPPRSTQHRVPLVDLVNPTLICILAVVNFTGLFPSWLSGFVTGLILCGIFTVWSLLKLYPAVSYSSARRSKETTHIAVHEPPVVVQAWMNLLPAKFQPYDLDTYEVKNTISVRITIEHHMLKIEYPDKNIPKRLNVDECIPADLKFHFHTDRVDLTTARISLLPEGIAGKRMFSKKYPIEIRPNAATPPDSFDHEKSSGPDQTKPSRSLAKSNQETSLDQAEDMEFKSVESRPESVKDETEKDIEDIEEDPAFENIDADEKVFYLFARADREKEDIYKAMLDAHYFLADTLLDVSRRGTEEKQIQRRETVRERKLHFADFMSKIMEPPTPVSGDSSSIDWCIHFFNVYLHRIFYDIHKSWEIKTLLKTRIYNKLLKIKITQWFKQINVTEIDMGSNLPKIQWVSRPTQNERGLWVHLGIEYGGIASATIETCGFNLGEDQEATGGGGVQLKALLEENPQALPVRPHSPGELGRKSSRIHAATNSDEEDSAESDSEESGEPQGTINLDSSNHRTRWWEMVGNSELVKTGINRLSNSEWWKAKTSKKMTLQLEVVSLKGVIVLNIPPPPSDRIWYGFKKKPDLDLRILPYYGDIKLGEDNSLFSTAVNKGIDVLVNRLKDEIDKFILLPNMDDLPVKIMTPFPASNQRS